MTLLTIVLAMAFASSVDPFSGGDRKLTLGLSAADNRRAIQRVVDEVSAAGGGRVEIPVGTWTTGSIQLKDGVELHLPQGATLKGSVDRRDYNANDAFPENRWSDDEEWSGGHLVWARCARDISITGPGVIDGNGPAFFGSCDEETRFPHYKYGLKLHPTDREWFRPGIMVAFFRCQNVRVEDVKLVRTTAWTCHFRCCDGVTLRNVTVDADRTIANSDGLSIDCTRNVVIEGCTLLTGDDGVPIRASCPFHAATNFCENIVIGDCDIWSCNYGIRFGVGTGLIRNVRVSDVRVHEAANASIGFTPAWKASPRNCYIEDVEIDNCTLLECAHPVIAGSANDSMVRNVTIRNCRFETLLPNLIWGGPRCRMSFENCIRRPIERVEVRHLSGWHEEEIRKGWSTFAEVRDDASAVRMTNCRVAEDGADIVKGDMYENPVIREDFPDPTFWSGDDGWVYGTATGLKTIRRSRNLVDWEDTHVPQIATEDVASLEMFSRQFWAPDVIKIGNRYLLYVTQFVNSDSNRLVCCESATPGGPFRFRSVVVESWKIGKRDCAIDSDVVRDQDGLWLFIGSVAGGIWRTHLTPDGLALDSRRGFEHVAGLIPASDDRPWIYSHRCYEGSYLYRRGGWWYLFVSCGAIDDGTYKLCVGRSRTLDGVFVDRKDVRMTEGGGELLLSTMSGADFSGAGHNGEIFSDFQGRTYMFIHSQWKGCVRPGVKWPNGPRCVSLQEVHWDKEGWPYFETGALLKQERKPDFKQIARKSAGTYLAKCP